MFHLWEHICRYSTFVCESHVPLVAKVIVFLFSLLESNTPRIKDTKAFITCM